MLVAEGIVDGGVLLDVFAVVETHGILIHWDNVLLPPVVQLVFVLVELVVVNTGGNVLVHCCTIWVLSLIILLAEELLLVLSLNNLSKDDYYIC